MAIAAFVLLALAFFLQAVSYYGTCTQGDNSQFIGGAIFSFPCILGCLVLLFASLVRNMRRRPQTGFVVSGLGSAAVVVLALSMLLFNSEVAHYTLLLGETPCGPDYFYSNERLGPRIENIIVGIVFAAMPGIVAVVAARTFWSALPSRLPNSS